MRERHPRCPGSFSEGHLQTNSYQVYEETTHFWHVLDHAAHALGEHVVGPVADRTNNRVYYITPTCADSSRRLGRKLTVWKAGRRSA